jgi:hypothetical protein
MKAGGKQNGALLVLFNPEDGSDMFVRNVGRLSADYTALHPRSQYPSFVICSIEVQSFMEPSLKILLVALLE